MRLTNANVLTLDAGDTVLDSLEVVDGRVVEAGTTSGPMLDLGGRTIVPGFVDAHCHFAAWALDRTRLRLQDRVCADGILERVRDRAGAAPRDAWLLGGGWADDLVSELEDAARLLDDAAGGRPVALLSRDCHALWTTPRSLAVLGIDPSRLDVPGGIVERDASGSFSGVLREESAWLVRRALPTDDLDAQVLLDAADEAARRGVTGLHDMDGAAALERWLEADAVRELPVRVRVHLLEPDLARVDALRELAAASPRVSIGHLKCFADGTLGSGTALLHEPEIPRPGHAPRQGLRVTTPEHLRELAERAAAAGLPLAVHAIGDRAFTEVLDALEATRAAWSDLAEPPRIEHAQLVRPADLTRAADLGVLLVVQPSMLVHDHEEALARWGHARSRHAYAYRSMLEAGCRIALSSDAPIEDLRPLAALHAATMRAGGAHGLAYTADAWNPDEALDPRTALRAATGAPLVPGEAADLVVLDGDPCALGWGEVRVVATMSAGRWTFDDLG